MSAAEDLYRQALALPEDERRALTAKLVASLPDEDDDIDPADVAEARRRLEEHRRDPSRALTSEQARARLDARRAAR